MIILIDREFIRNYRAEILLAGILALSAFLNIWNLWNEGISNTYYAAAVKSMLVNPAAGFFNSLDPAGFITIDKPPAGLWVQATFAAVLGFSGWVLDLPQALAGIGSVALIYLIVSRPFGKPAGLVSALALAVTPILVAVSRNETMDSQMIFVILLAVFVVMKATRERSLPWFLASVILIGIAFNIKMIQAFIVVPAVFAVYFLGTTDFSWKKRFLHAGLAAIVLLAVSLSWAVAVDMVPADQRPFIGGSGDNSVLSLIIDYNGMHRLGIGDSGGAPGTGGTGNGGPGTSAGGLPGRGNGTAAAAGPAGSSFAGSGGSGGASGTTPGALQGSPGGLTSSGEGDPQVPSGMQPPGSSGFTSGSAPGSGGMGGGGGMNSGGSSGIFRLFGSGLAGDISWLLAFALIGVLAWVRRPAVLSLKGLEDAGFTSEKGLVLTAMLLWLIPGLLYFSFTSGFWHDYYLATIAPPLAGLVGIGAAGLYRNYAGGSRAGWLLVIAVPVTGLLQVLFLSYDAEWAGPLLPLVLLGTLVCTGLLAWMQVRKRTVPENHRTLIIAAAIGILFIAPFVWSCTPIMNGASNLPTAGPQGSRGGAGGGMSGGSMPSGMAGTGGPGIAGTGNSSFGMDIPARDRSFGQVYNTSLSDRNSLAGPGSGTGTSGMAATGGVPMNSMSGGSAPGSSAGGPGSSGMNVSGGSPGSRTNGFAALSGGGDDESSGRLVEYLLAHTTNETWILAVPSSHTGADIIIRTGKPVMCIGGFTGSDQFLNVTAIQDYIREGKVRFFQTGGSGGGGGTGYGDSGIFSWVSSHCTAVNLTEGTGTGAAGSPGTGSGSSLYDCRGAAGTV